MRVKLNRCLHPEARGLEFRERLAARHFRFYTASGLLQINSDYLTRPLTADRLDFFVSTLPQGDQPRLYELWRRVLLSQ